LSCTSICKSQLRFVSCVFTQLNEDSEGRLGLVHSLDTNFDL